MILVYYNEEQSLEVSITSAGEGNEEALRNTISSKDGSMKVFVGRSGSTEQNEEDMTATSGGFKQVSPQRQESVERVSKLLTSPAKVKQDRLRAGRDATGDHEAGQYCCDVDGDGEEGEGGRRGTTRRRLVMMRSVRSPGINL